MDIKRFGCAIALLLAFTGAAESQNTAKRPRIGLLLPRFGSSDPDRSRVKAFREGLGELGYFEGKNITIEYRFAEGKPDRLAVLAAELVALEVDVIVTGGNEGFRGVQKATSTIPVVMAFGSGFVTDLAQPGANITGLTTITQQLVGKRLELLGNVVPSLSRVAILWSSPDPPRGPALQEADELARAAGVTLQKLEVKNSDDLVRAFTAMRQEQADALSVQPGQFLSAHRRQLVQLAAKDRLPAIYTNRRFVEAGGLMSYGAVRLDEFRRAAIYVDKILKGAKPADLPVEQPTKFELVINLKTARQLGITIPQSLLYRAEKVIK